METAVKVRVSILQKNCTQQCRSEQHGNMITAAVTKRSLTDEELYSYLNFICGNCGSVKDSVGRTALHVAASCGRIPLIRWLVNVKKANINIQDEESGYTPLHRAVFYGNINAAVELIKLGADISILDRNSMSAFEHVIRDGSQPWEPYGQIFTWGLNKNNSLGPFGTRTSPEYLDAFHRKFPNVHISEAYLGKFHSVFIDMQGDAFSCGHGLGGRLGLGSEMSVVEPVRIPFNDPENTRIAYACIGRDHSVFCFADGKLYTVGLNKYRVLGISPPPEKVTSPTLIKSPVKRVYGILAGAYHTAVWSSKSLYVWGLNVGQFGNLEKRMIIMPKPVRLYGLERSEINKAACSDAAIAVALSNGDIFVLHEYRCRKIANKFLDRYGDISLIGGKLNTSLDPDLENDPMYELKVLVRTQSNYLYLWQESNPYLCRLIYSIPKQFMIRKAFINANEISFVNVLGEAYKGTIGKIIKKRSIENDSKLLSFLYKEDSIYVDIKKIPKIHRAVSIVSDPKGDDYCIIQQEPYSNSYETTKVPNELPTQLVAFYREALEDGFHDIKIRVQNTIFPAHKYILASKSEVLQELFQRCKDEEIILRDISADTMKEMLTFIYSGTCDILDISEDMDEFQRSSIPSENKTMSLQNPLLCLLKASKLYGCHELTNLLSDIGFLDSHLIDKKCSGIDQHERKFDIDSFPEYYDIVLECSDGVKVNAHKCILAARADFFKSMFSARWSSTTSSMVFAHPSYIAKALLKFLYMDCVDFFEGHDYDFIVRLLIAADEYMIESLKKHCENYFQNCLDLKCAAELLSLSVCYRAETLRKNVLHFIVCNAAHFLEFRVLEEINDETLEELTQHYIETRLASYNRIITPYSSAVSKETIDEIINTYSADAEEVVVSKKVKSAPKNIKHRKQIPEKTFTDIKYVETREGAVRAIFCRAELLVSTKPESEVSRTYQYIKTRLSSILRASAMIELEDPPFDNNFPPLCNLSRHIGPSDSHANMYKRHKMSKLSQRERKRLSSETTETNQVPETPKNPWKVIPPLSSSSNASPNSEPAFSDILSSERKQKENLMKMTNKLLLHTQMEDKAIADLQKFYNIANIEDEFITVERVDIGRVACPVWVPRKHGLS